MLGRPDPVMGEVGRAYIVAAPGANLTMEEILDFLKNRLARFKIPTDVIFVDQLPLTPRGKVKNSRSIGRLPRNFKSDRETA